MNPLLKTAVFTIFLPGTITVVIPVYLIAPEAELSVEGLRIVGIPCMVTGAMFYFWCAWHFAVTGQGTPAPIDEPKVLIVKGLYRYVRNPMYIGVLSIVIGEAISFGSPSLILYAVILWLAFHLFVVIYEEPHLRNKFGSSYETYCREVRRWIPGIRGAGGLAPKKIDSP